MEIQKSFINFVVNDREVKYNKQEIFEYFEYLFDMTKKYGINKNDISLECIVGDGINSSTKKFLIGSADVEHVQVSNNCPSIKVETLDSWINSKLKIERRNEKIESILNEK